MQVSHTILFLFRSATWAIHVLTKCKVPIVLSTIMTKPEPNPSQDAIAKGSHQFLPMHLRSYLQHRIKYQHRQHPSKQLFLVAEFKVNGRKMKLYGILYYFIITYCDFHLNPDILRLNLKILKSTLNFKKKPVLTFLVLEDVVCKLVSHLLTPDL